MEAIQHSTTEPKDNLDNEVNAREILHFLKHGLYLLRPYLRQQIYLGLTVFALILYEMALPLSLAFLIDQVLVSRDGQNLLLVVSVLVFLFLLSSVARVIQTYLRAFFSTEMFYDQYISLYGYLPQLPESYYDAQEPGRITSLFTNDLIAIFATLRDLVISGLSAFLQLFIIMATLFYMSWEMALVVLVLMPFTIVLPQHFMKKTAIADRGMKTYMDGIYAAIEDFVSAQSVVRAFGIAEQLVTRFAREVIQRPGERRTRNSLGTIKEMSNFAPFLARMITVSSEVQQAFINTLVISVGAYLVYSGSITIGIFSTYILFIPRVGAALTTLTSFASGLVTASVSLRRVEALIEATQPVRSDAQPLVIRDVGSSDIQLDDVSFSYTGIKTTLHNVNLTLPLGKSAAIVGRSGSGKTTLLKLILHFYEPQSGKVLVDGKDLLTLNHQLLTSQFGVVLQSKGMLNTTIRENIRLAKPDATDEEIVLAARSAEIHDTIMGLPDGYDTNVGDGGQRLSEGQRQRIALARAIVRNPSILILDEVTAALDPETEMAINATIKRLAQERTVILVTHRLASAKFADQLIVLDDGKIIERGTHDQLLAMQRVYAQMWRLQSGFEVSRDGHHATVSGERLKAIPLFQDLDSETLDELAKQFASEHVETESALYQQGDQGERFFIVVRGTVTVSALDSSKQSVRLADLQDGDYFGEVEMITPGRRSTTVIAKSPTLLLTLHASQFQEIMGKMSSLQKVMTQMALGRSLTTISSLGRRRRNLPVIQEMATQDWQTGQALRLSFQQFIENMDVKHRVSREIHLE